MSRSHPSDHAELVAWVAEVAGLATPDSIHWVDGSDAENAENAEIVQTLVSGGTFTRLAGKTDSYWCRSDPTDVARVEDRTYR